jgi:DNA repair ATPase RecN
MKQFRELNASIAALRALLAGSDIRPEQRKHVEEAVQQLRRLRRKTNPRMSDIYRCVRRVTDRLVSAFFLS